MKTLVNTCQFGSVKWVGIFANDDDASKSQCSPTLAVDWPDKLIGPGGLLLVISYLLPSQFHV
jgi:hypothetical protein